MEKQCKDCGEVKHFTMYPKDKRHPLGHCGRVCTECTNSKNKAKSNPVIKQDKECSDCKTIKPYTEFQRDKRSVDGLRWNCRQCRGAQRRKEWANNNEENRRKRSVYRHLNKDKISEYKKKDYIKHRDKILAKCKIYAEENKEAKAEYSKKHYSENRHIYITNARKRESRLKEGINMEFTGRMKEIYYVCETFSKVDEVEYQVDHIVPLTHKDVCGLHVPWNIQILTRDENQSKKNKFDGTYHNETWRS